MAFPRRSSRSPRSRYTLGLLLLTAVTLLVLDLPGTGPLQPVRNVLGGILSPIRSAGDAVFAPIGNGWKGAFGYDDVKDENDRLRARLEEAKASEAEIERLQADNEALQRIAEVSAQPFSTRTAQVVSEPLSSFDQTLEIDQGSGDGVKKGMAVITGMTSGTGGSILGRIEEVRGGRSKVELITSPGFAAGVSIGDDRAVIQGQGRGKPLLVEQLRPTTEVEVGDYVNTSGIEDSAFPASLKVGRVSRIRDAADGQSVSVEVTPLADLGSVYVKVVLKDPPK